MASRNCGKPQVKLQAEREHAASILKTIDSSRSLAFKCGCCIERDEIKAERDAFFNGFF